MVTPLVKVRAPRSGTRQQTRFLCLPLLTLAAFLPTAQDSEEAAQAVSAEPVRLEARVGGACAAFTTPAGASGAAGEALGFGPRVIQTRPLAPRRTRSCRGAPQRGCACLGGGLGPCHLAVCRGQATMAGLAAAAPCSPKRRRGAHPCPCCSARADKLAPTEGYRLPLPPQVQGDHADAQHRLRVQQED